MAKVPTTTIRIDPEVKGQASKIFDDLGLSLLCAVVRHKGMPFDVVIRDNEQDGE